MKKAVVVALGALLLGTLARASEPEGFRDLRWGDAAPPRWQRKHGGGEWVHSTRGRGSSLGTVPLERVDYEFSGGALVRVVLLFRGRPSFLKLKEDLGATFSKAGEPVLAPPASEAFFWRGSSTWAYLDSLGESVPGLLLLCRAPQPTTPEGTSREARACALLNRLRLYEHLDVVLGRSLQVITGEISTVERSLQESKPQSVLCRDLQVDREQDQQREQRSRRDLVAAQDAVVAERGRLGKEADTVRAELAALRKP